MTTDSMVVNGVSIDKTIISQLLQDNRKLEAVKYLCDNAKIGLLESKEIIEQFPNGNIAILLDKTKKQQASFIEVYEPTTIGRGKKLMLFLAIMSVFTFWFLYSYIGFIHIPHHFESFKNNYLPSSLFNSDNNEVVDAQIAGDSVIVDYATEDDIMSPMDTLMWYKSKINDSYLPEDVIAKYEKYTKLDFSNLIVAKDKPTNIEAQTAIVRVYQNEVTSLLEEYKAHIVIGKCYMAPLQSSEKNGQEIARVTAMISGFNKKDGNLGNIQRPLYIVYDFVKFESDPTTWYLTDFSQTIPYDYFLNKDRW